MVFKCDSFSYCGMNIINTLENIIKIIINIIPVIYWFSVTTEGSESRVFIIIIIFKSIILLAPLLRPQCYNYIII